MSLKIWQRSIQYILIYLMRYANFWPSCLKSFTLPSYLWGYWTKQSNVHQIFTRCSSIISTVNAYIYMAITVFQVSEKRTNKLIVKILRGSVHYILKYSVGYDNFCHIILKDTISTLVISGVTEPDLPFKLELWHSNLFWNTSMPNGVLTNLVAMVMSLEGSEKEGQIDQYLRSHT